MIGFGSSGWAAPIAFIPDMVTDALLAIDVGRDITVKRYPNLTRGRSKSGAFGVAVANLTGNVFLSRPAFGVGSLMTVVSPNRKSGNIQNLAVPDGGTGVAYDPLTLAVYLAGEGSGSLFKLTAIGTYAATYELGLKKPYALVAVDAGNHRSQLYITEQGGNSVAVVDPVYGRLLRRIGVGQSPLGLAASSDGKKIFVANHDDQTVSVIDVSSGLVTAINVGGYPTNVALSSDQQILYVTLDSWLETVEPSRGKMAMINLANPLLQSAYAIGKRPIGIGVFERPKGDKIYITNNASNSLSVVTVGEDGHATSRKSPAGEGPTALGTFLTPPLPTEGGGSIYEFVSGALQEWGQAQFLQLIGLGEGGYTEEQINTIIAQLNDIANQLALVELQVQQLLGDFQKLANYMTGSSYAAEATNLTNTEFSVTSAMNSFSNYLLLSSCSTGATNSNCYLTLSQVINQPAILNGLFQCFSGSDCQLSQLATWADILSGTPGSGPFSTTMSDLTTAAYAYLGSEINTLISNQSNIMNVGSVGNPPMTQSIFDQYNNALMQQFSGALRSLQEIYTLEASLLYLQAYGPTKFSKLTTGEQGIAIPTATTYPQVLQNLNAIFQKRIQTLQNIFGSAFISDYSGNSSFVSKPANTMTGVPGPWTQSSDQASNNYEAYLYVWQGLMPSGIKGYLGQWDGANLGAMSSTDSTNSAATYTFTPAVCGQNPVSFFAVTGFGGQFQCSTSYSTNWVASTGSPYQWTFDALDHDAYFYFFMDDLATSIVYESYSNGSNLFTPNSSGYQVELGPMMHPRPYKTVVDFGVILSYHSANGYLGSFGVSGQASTGLGTDTWSMSLVCPVQPPMCYVMQGAGDSICLGANKIQLTEVNSDNTARIAYVGTCGPQ